MKAFIKKRINEEIVHKLVEELIGEDYPSSFDMEHFKTLKSFAQRVKYCEEHLKRIAQGSGRITYMVDNTKVLKLAKNTKGIAQNEIEIQYSQYTDIDNVIARIFDSHQDALWLEMELATKLKVADFKRITGYSFDDYRKAIYNHGVDSSNAIGGHKYPMNKELVETMWEDEFVYSIFNFIGGYDVPTGDLERLNSYGVVKRNGEDTIIVIDYGLSSDVYSGYYS